MNVPSILEHVVPPQLRSGSTAVSQDQTEPSAATVGSDGKDRSPSHRVSCRTSTGTEMSRGADTVTSSLT